MSRVRNGTRSPAILSEIRKALTALCAGIAFPCLALAQEAAAPASVVELFTAQGCASCPPADALFGELVRKGDVLALAYHVDYWNYLGWADTLATRENTRRQYDYAKTFRRNGVYTPQAVVNGREHVNGADGARLETTIRRMNKGAHALSVPVSATIDGDRMRIAIGAAVPGGPARASITAAYFAAQTRVEVREGENAGQTVDYFNAVSDLETVGMWQGRPMTLDLPLSVLGQPGKDGCAILLQQAGPEGEPGPILGAASLLYRKGS